jgi:hypothetical protein
MRAGENYRCDCCGAEVQSAAIEVRKWDWFKCYLPRTHHYCPSCKESAEARAMFAKSRVKPSNAEITGRASGPG